MRWVSVAVNGRAREKPEGKRSAGGRGPGKRWGHTCNSVRGGRLLYVFGGYGTHNSQTNDVHVFDTVKQTWSKPMMKGNSPSPRDSHSCTTVGNRLFVFGGTDGSNPLKDLHILDTTTNQWIVPAISGEGPPAREGHSAALVDKRIFIFGGCGKSIGNPEEVYYNDLYILDTEALAWERARTFGIAPCPRDSHTCSSWGNKIIVLGGEDSSDCYLSDVHMLDADTLAWKQINTSGQMIAPRAGHATVAVGSNLFVFGGFTDARNLYDDLHVLNVDSGTWSRMICVNQGPSARFSVAGDCLDESKGIIVFIGGCNQLLEALDDMYFLYTDMPVQYGLSEQSQEKSSLRRELKKKCRDNYLPGEELGKDNDMQMLEVKTPSQPLDLRRSHAGIQSESSSLSGKVTFEARILELNQYAYTIETTINGQKLRGVVISATSGSGEDSHAYPNKRKMGTDIETTKEMEPRSVLNTVPIIPQGLKSSYQGQIAAAHGKESMTQASGSVVPSLMLTDDDMLNNSSIMEPSKVPYVKNETSDNVKNDPDKLIQLPKLSDNIKNDPEILVQFPKILVQLQKSSDNLKNDPDNMVHLPEPSGKLENDSKDFVASLLQTEGPKSEQEKLEWPPVPFEDLKNVLENLKTEKDEWSNVSSIPIVMPAAERSSSVQGAGEQDSSINNEAIG